MQLKLLGYSSLYHAIENTDNQNSVKPLYNQRYSTQLSNHVLRILFPPKFRKQHHTLPVSFKCCFEQFKPCQSGHKSILRGSVYKTSRSLESQLKAIYNKVCAYVSLIVMCTVFSMAWYKIFSRGNPWNIPRVTCIFLVYHSKALQN